MKRVEEKESNNDSESEEEFVYTSIYTNKPFFDWKLAKVDFGLDFEIIGDNGFETFFQEKFIEDYIELRKSYIKRDFLGFRFIAHKFKGSFK